VSAHSRSWFDKAWLGKVGGHAARIPIVLVLGGLLGATMARFAPGYGTDAEELDSRLSQASVEALRNANGSDANLLEFYGRYLSRLVRGDFGESQTLHKPVRQLLAERFPETLKSVGLGLALGWAAGLALAMVAAMKRGSIADAAAALAAGTLLCVPAAVLALLFVMA